MKNFITIEGCDGVGKTHQTKLLKEYCIQHGSGTKEQTHEKLLNALRRRGVIQ